MSTIELYKQEIETALEHAKEKLVSLKSKIRSFSDVERLEFIKDNEELEKMTNDMRTKIKELNTEMEDSLNQIKDDIDSSNNVINESFAKLNRSLV